MNILELLLQGFGAVLTLQNLLIVMFGCMLGTVVGLLPGLGPSAGIAVLLPLLFGQDALTAMILLTSIYFGAMYGGAISSILINTPGDAAAVATTFDGYPLAKMGKPGLALGISAISSFIAGTLAVVMFMLFAPVLVEAAFEFGAPEFFAFMVLGISAIASFAGSSKIKTFISGLLGLMLATVGVDVITGQPRFTFGSEHLFEGIDFIIVALGLFAIGEMFYIAERSITGKDQKVSIGKYRELFPSLKQIVFTLPTTIRGAVLGFMIGVLPGAGSTLASFISYSVNRNLVRNPKFGQGDLRGVAAPESANNAAATGALVPMLTLGIPGSGSTAIMLGALLLIGLQPGPFLFDTNPTFVWGLIAAMYVSNLVLVVMNLPLVGMFAQVIRLPVPLLSMIVLLLAFTGVFAIHYTYFDMTFALIVGLIGYLMKKVDIPFGPLVLTLVLGEMMERAFRQSLLIGQGDWSIFLTRPISLTLFIITLVFAFGPALFNLFKRNLAKTEAPRL